jgi:phage terminase small subunit
LLGDPLGESLADPPAEVLGAERLLGDSVNDDDDYSDIGHVLDARQPDNQDCKTLEPNVQIRILCRLILDEPLGSIYPKLLNELAKALTSRGGRSKGKRPASGPARVLSQRKNGGFQNMLRRSRNKVPAHLLKDGARLYRDVASEYGIADAGGLAVLTTAAECLDRMRAAQRAIQEHGAIVMDRYGKPKVHPACSLEKDARAGFLLAIKGLNLDIEPLRDRAGRPGVGLGVTWNAAHAH